MRAYIILKKTGTKKTDKNKSAYLYSILYILFAAEYSNQGFPHGVYLNNFKSVYCLVFTFYAGGQHTFLNPNLLISEILWSTNETERSSPVSPTSLLPPDRRPQACPGYLKLLQERRQIRSRLVYAQSSDDIYIGVAVTQLRPPRFPELQAAAWRGYNLFH